MAEYQCESCNYNIETQKTVRICPYCGKSNTVKPVVTAAKLLDEIERTER